MTKIEKAKEIIRQYGECLDLPCDEAKNNECVCYEWCKSNNCETFCPGIDGMNKRIEICEKYLKENTMKKNVFDKSKVLVAGLDEIEVDKKCYVAEFVSANENCIELYVIDKDKEMVRTVKDDNGLYVDEYGIMWRFAYPYEEPVKTWRPIKTIEEAEPFLGKKIKRKDVRKMLMLITIIHVEDDSTLFLNGLPALSIFNQYIMDDGSPVGIEE